MEILKLNDDGVLGRVVSALRQGEVLAVPTDTVYGLIADATNEKAVQRIFEIKGREKGKPLPWFVLDIEMAKEYAQISAEQERFLQKVWPGAVTVILRLKTQDKGLRDTIGMRMPKDDFLQSVLKEMGVPLAQTSANISGRPPAQRAEEVCEYFSLLKYSPALLVDGEERGGEASSVIDVTGATPKILREGAVSRETLSRILLRSGLPAPLGL